MTNQDQVDGHHPLYQRGFADGMASQALDRQMLDALQQCAAIYTCEYGDWPTLIREFNRRQRIALAAIRAATAQGVNIDA